MTTGPRKTGSNILNLMIDAAAREQRPRKQVNVLQGKYKAITPEHIRAFISISKCYDCNDPLEKRISVCILMQSVLREVRRSGYQKEYEETTVDVSCLTASEFMEIIKVVEVMKDKSQTMRKPTEYSNGAVMLAEFFTD